MKQRIDPSRALLALARSQEGAVSRAQAERLGLPPSSWKRLVGSGRWVALGPGVASVRTPTTRTTLWAGVLHAGEGSAVGGLSALWLEGLADEPSPPHLVWSPRKVVSTPLWEVRRAPREALGFPPRTRVTDSLLDAWPALGGDGFVLCAGRAIQRRRINVEALEAAVARRRRIPDRRRLEAALADLGVGARSPLESRYLRDVERAHGLPAGTWQSRRAGAFVLDVEYGEFGVAVELDGRRYHDDVFRDLRRDNAHLVAGVSTLRYGAADLGQRPCDVARQVAAVLASRGWRGALRRCPSCS